jgi:hypothetical protein
VSRPKITKDARKRYRAGFRKTDDIGFEFPSTVETYKRCKIETGFKLQLIGYFENQFIIKRRFNKSFLNPFEYFLGDSGTGGEGLAADSVLVSKFFNPTA